MKINIILRSVIKPVSVLQGRYDHIFSSSKTFHEAHFCYLASQRKNKHMKYVFSGKVEASGVGN